MNKKIIKLLKKTKKATKTGSLPEIAESLKEIKQLLVLTLLSDQLGEISQSLKSSQPNDSHSVKSDSSTAEKKSEVADKSPKSMEILEKIATTKTEGDVTYFLLHRHMDSFEYDSADDDTVNELTTDSETEWYAESDGWQDLQDGNNPVVSCWIPSGKISSVVNPEPNTGTWGELGENPHRYGVKASVKPGTYTIYQELRQ